MIGAIFGAGLAYVLVSFVPRHRTGSWATAALCGVLGLQSAGLPGVVAGLLLGFVLGWFTFWLTQGTYRASVPPYATPGQVLWHYTFRFICGVIFFFLIAPILVIIPLSFNAEDFFTFTPEMLPLDPAGYSLKHYEDFFTNSDWQQALRNSLQIAPVATILSVTSAPSRPSACRKPMCRSGGRSWRS